MRNPEEVVKFCKKRIRQLGLGQIETLKKAGLSSTIFAMSLSRNIYMSVESLAALSKQLDVSVAEILGCSDTELPEDIQEMINMLVTLPVEDRKIISMNIQNYFNLRRNKTEQ